MGGTAEVWRAMDERTNRPVAVKFLHQHLAADDAARHRLIAEAAAVRSLSHPGIIRVLAIDAGDRPAVVLELVEGESLAQRIQRGGRLPQRDAAHIAACLADALYHAHTRGVIHRDVKPGNVLLAADSRPVLIDFGIARILGDEHEPRTETGMVMGTLRYMAPEQLAGQPITPRVDLYGLGAVLFEMLTGARPFPAASPAELLEEQAAGAPLAAGVDPALARVAQACLAPRPEDRPLHAGVVAAALRAWLAGGRLPAPAIGLASPSPASPGLASPSPATPHHPPVHDLPPTTLLPVVAFHRPGRMGAEPGRPAALTRGPRAFGPARLAVAAMLAVLVLFVGAATVAITNLGAQGATADGAANGNTTPTPLAIPALPAWAASLAAEYRQACGTSATAVGASANQLEGMGQAAAQRYITALSAQCSDLQASSSTAAPAAGAHDAGGSGRGQGKSPGHGNGPRNGNGRGSDGADQSGAGGQES